MNNSSEIILSFFVPCYNEENNIINTIKNIEFVIHKINIECEILIIDDKSNDKTVEKIKDFQNHSKLNIVLIQNEFNKGLGTNYVDGAFIAKGNYYMLVNGDNAEPKEEILKICDKLGKADVIIPYFENKDNRRLIRKILSKTFTFLVNLLSGNNIPYYNGPALHKRYNVMRFSPDTFGFAYQAELITRIILEGFSYQTVKILNKDRKQGTSSAFSFQNILSVIHSLLQIALRRLRFILFYRNKNDKK